jgi:transcriptional regulator with XRE-family HTH domain
VRNIGEKIREARVERGITQDRLAELLHSKQNTISQWESGVNEPSIEIIRQIAKILGVDANFLFDMDGV